MSNALFATKAISVLTEESEETGEHSLKRVLGPVNLMTLGIGAIIGAGIFVITGHHGTGSKHTRSQQVSERDAGPPLLDLLEAAAHIAHTGDAIGNEQRENRFFVGA